jgi:hypothetical protein
MGRDVGKRFSEPRFRSRQFGQQTKSFLRSFDVYEMGHSFFDRERVVP